jgi:hypothetical protein
MDPGHTVSRPSIVLRAAPETVTPWPSASIPMRLGRPISTPCAMSSVTGAPSILGQKRAERRRGAARGRVLGNVVERREHPHPDTRPVAHIGRHGEVEG